MTGRSASALFEPLRIRDVELRNRLWLSPMCQYAVDALDGVPTDWHLAHLGSFARGGAGLVMTEAAAVLPEGRISAWDLGLWDDAQQDALARIAAFVRGQGAAFGVQLAHAGRKGSLWRSWTGSGSMAPADGGWMTVAPSALAHPGHAEPRALTADGIASVVDAFAASAARAVAAGVDVVEVHAAHGYLLHEFLSPLANTRDDAYGGPLERRARMLRETVRAVRAAVGERVPVLVRLSGSDWADGGITLDDTRVIARWLVDDGADHLDVSSGGVAADQRIPTGPGYQVPLARGVREAVAGTGATVNAVGLIDTAAQAEEIVASGRADAVMLGRAMLREPHLALLAAEELGADLGLWPQEYRRAIRSA